MKSLSPALQSHLSSGTTTLCWCWKIARRDGAVLGFTDHDAPLTFDSTTYLASSGFTASEVQSSLGLAVDNLSVMGALSSASLNEDDLAAGLFDNAAIEIWRVNWASPEERVLLRKGSLGEVRRGKTGFTAEVRGLAHALNQPVGRVYAHGCDADLGDGRCTVSVNPVPGTVTAAADSRRFTASGLASYATGWFTAGKLSFTSGANAGRAMEVKRHTLSAGVASFELWQAMSQPIAPGDGFTVTPGCDKQFATCQSKFANAIRFRGFPYMLGDDAALAAVASSTPLDGGSRYGN
jgi:uncharacterized phage protein (TIGR02218 family)